MFFWKKKETKDITSKEYLSLKSEVDKLDSEVKKLKTDMIFIENEVYEKIDKLLRKRQPKIVEEAQSQPVIEKNLNTSLPFKFI